MALLRTVFALGIVSALVLCVSWQETRVRHEERRLRELGAMLETRTSEVQRLQAQVARLKSPQRIMRLVEVLDIGLRPPIATAPQRQRELVLRENIETAGGSAPREIGQEYAR